MVRHIPVGGAPTSLLELIQRDFTRSPETEVVGPNSWFRASGLAYLCPRETVYAYQSKEVLRETPRLDLMLIFLHGTALHWAIQNVLLAPYLRGIWRCNRCGELHGGYRDRHRERIKEMQDDPGIFTAELIEDYKSLRKEIRYADRPVRCRCDGLVEEAPGVAKAGESLFSYEELWFCDPELLVCGHPDGFLEVPWREGLGVLEAKSIGSSNAWKVKHTPILDHIVQLQTYLMLTGFEWGTIFYWEKGGFGIKALCEHELDRDEELISALRESVVATRTGLLTGVLPDRICEDLYCARAEGCKFRARCFKDE